MVFVCEAIYCMESPDLRIIHPRPIIIPFQSTAITKLLFLLFLAVVLIFIIQLADGFGAYPRHRQPKWIIMRFPGEGAGIVLNNQVIKEHPDNSCRDKLSQFWVSLLRYT